MKLALLIAQLVLYSLLLGILVVMFLRERRAKKLQNALLNELQPGFAPQQRWFRVNLARLPFFSRRMRLFGFEAKGLLIDQGEVLRVVAVRPDGERLERVVPKAPASVRWRGNTGLRSANLHWLELGAGPDAIMVAADTGMNASASREATADLLRALLPRQPLEASALDDFAFEKHPTALAVVVAALALLVGALTDIAITEHQLLRPRSLHLVGMLTAPLGLLLYPVLVRRKVPARESLALSVLGVVALGIALPGIAMRADQWLSRGPAPTPYRLVSGAQLQPVEPGPPAVTLNQVREYWSQFEPGSIHDLDIVHGPLGVWQLDRSRLNVATRDWYRRRDAAAASAPGS
ncbi:hypothetical protein [Roseateles sp.]|uniref:hypothetical protein n=1 Tax=Roseateles sp. TaxID=1971397 RepID=UPI0039E8D612